MRKLLLIAVCFLGLAGCVYTSNYEVGRAFDETKVSQIVKGKTTEQELIAMFGEPFTKTVVSDTDSKWIYTHTKGTASAQAFTMKSEANSTVSTLDILIRDGVVVNYSFSSGNLPVMTSVN